MVYSFISNHYRWDRSVISLSTILPSGEEINVSPDEILRYLDPDGLRQLLRQERLRWNLKPNKDSDFYSNTTLFKYSGDLHNQGDHQRMDVRAFPDNGANPGHAGIYVDGGEFGMVHNHEKWDDAMSNNSKDSISPRVEIGVHSTHLIDNESEHPIAGGKELPDVHGHGMNPETGEIEEYSRERTAVHLYDSYDGRAYVLSNDENYYVNNKYRESYKKLPGRTDARVVDIPLDLSDLDNSSNIVSDWDYHHTDNNFNNSHRYILDNLDDRTFVYPEISQDESGTWVSNEYMGLDGRIGYAEGDGVNKINDQPDLTGTDRQGAANSSYNANKGWTSDNGYNVSGYFPGVFRSFEELLKVDITGQKRSVLIHSDTPSGRRRQNFYQFDGIWEYNSFELEPKVLRNLDPNQDISNMENKDDTTQPYPYYSIYPQDSNGENNNYHTSQLYQWRYNRVSIYYYSKNLKIHILNGGEHYKVGDILRYNFLNKWIYYRVTQVGTNDRITGGNYIQPDDPDHPDITQRFEKFEHNPSTNGVGVVFKDQTSTGRDALLVIECPPSFEAEATQIKNNLYAYVDVVPTVASDNSTEWSDVETNDTTNPHFVNRSTAPSAGHTGINSGRGGPEPTSDSTDIPLYEHGGNATAGPHVHLFKYVTDTTGNTFEMIDGVKVYTGRWVDQGPMGLERPSDVKALYLSNSDTNNFNNYYKFMLDAMIDQFNRNSDSVTTDNGDNIGDGNGYITDKNDPNYDPNKDPTNPGSPNYDPTYDINTNLNINVYGNAYLHTAERDPWQQPVGHFNIAGPSQALYDMYVRKGYRIVLLRPTVGNDILDHQAFFDKRIDPVTKEIYIVEITDKVIYKNAGTRVTFYYNKESKLDPNYGYGAEPHGWYNAVGTIGR